MDKDERIAEVYKRAWQEEKESRKDLKAKYKSLAEARRTERRRREELEGESTGWQRLLQEERERHEALKRKYDELQSAYEGKLRQRQKAEAEKAKCAAAWEELQSVRREKVVLENRLAAERWKVRSLKNRKWWRLGTLLGDAKRHPKRIPVLAVKAFKLVVTRNEPIPRPRARNVDASVEHRASGARNVEVASNERKQPYLAPRQPRKLPELRVAAVLDGMSYACFEPEASLLSFRPDNFAGVIDNGDPDLLLVESAWQGAGGSWQYMVGSYSYSETLGLPQLKALVSYCRKAGIPTVFWNKEDPVHFSRFKEAAQLFDHVLTTDANCVGAYEGLGIDKERIGVLPFGAQPKLHNPVTHPDGRLEEVCFAGTYYHNRHPERRRQLELLLDAASPFGLRIYDRTYERGDSSMSFPERFQPYVYGALPYEEMVRAYKRHRVFVNVNSVTDSPTMFSRRVFELLACGTPVVSNPSEGIEGMLGGAVDTVDSAEAATGAIERLMTDNKYWRERSLAGVEAVLREHTYAHRLAHVAQQAGVNVQAPEKPSVSIILLDDDMLLSGFLAEIAQQTLRPAEIVVGTTSSAGTQAEVRFFEQEETVEVGFRYKILARAAQNEWIAILDGGRAYSRECLSSLAQKAVFTRADIIGFNPEGIEDAYVDCLGTEPVLVKRELIATRGWVRSSEELRKWCSEGVLMYAAHHTGEG